MSKVILLFCFLFVCLITSAQMPIVNSSVYYSMGKYYYDNKDYLNAYKYLLGYKYLNIEKLNKPANNLVLSSLDDVINYCEAQIRKGISESSTFSRRGWSQPNIDSINIVLKKNPPVLPPKRIEQIHD